MGGSAAWPDSLSPGWQPTHSGVAVELAAELEDLFVLGSEAGERFVAEVSESLDGLIAVSEALFEGGDLLFESVDLGVAGRKPYASD